MRNASLILALALAACDSTEPPDPDALDLSGTYDINADEGVATWTVNGSNVTLTISHYEHADGHTETGEMSGTYFAATSDMQLAGTHTHVQFMTTDPARFEGTVSLGGARVEGEWCRDYLPNTQSATTECDDLTLIRR